MSHLEHSTVTITDLKALDAACKTLGITFVEGKKSFTSYGNAQHPCNHAITGFPGTNWEVGLLSADTNTNKISYSLAYDPYSYGTNNGHPITTKLCKQQADGNYTKDGKHQYEHLMNQYSLEVLKAKARLKGYQFQTTTVGGKLKLEVFAK